MNQNLGKFNCTSNRQNVEKTNKKQTKTDKVFVSSFDSDFLRVTSCSGFRRLQDKTQLFPLEKNDYARTRLTHSSEVAAVGKAIALSASRKLEELNIKMGIQLTVLPICSFLHDMGNPPFGHYGESIIRNFFVKKWNEIVCNNDGETIKLCELIKEGSQEYFDFINFDGNAQALRLVTHVEKGFCYKRGLNLTSAVLGGLIKYPYSSSFGKESHKIGYFKSEEDVILFLKKNHDYFDNKIHPTALLLEASDDISMFVSDFEDAIEKQCIGITDIENYKSRKKVIIDFKKKMNEFYNNNCKNTINAFANSITPLLYSIKNELILQVADVFANDYEKITYIQASSTKYKRNDKKHKTLIEQTELYPVVEMSKELLRNKVYCDKKIVSLELKGDTILTKLLETFVTSLCNLSYKELISNKSSEKDYKVINMLSKNYFENYKQDMQTLINKNEYTFEKDIYARLHLAVDQICGMTDSYAVELFETIFQ